MKFDDSAIQSCLAATGAVESRRYVQWLVEDPDCHDFKVVASVSPEGAVGYEVAHRTGVIGQVFRFGRPIVITNTARSAIYDPFDSSIDWEICLPVLHTGKLMGVVNLEGTGALENPEKTVRRISGIIRDTTGGEISQGNLQIDSPHFCVTQRVGIASGGADCEPLDVVSVARAVARGGQSTLIVGHYPELLGRRSPSMSEACQQGLTVSYCFYGVDTQLDLLATGSFTSKDMMNNRMSWWGTVCGRYTFVLIPVT